MSPALSRHGPLAAGLALLLFLWAGPLVGRAETSFAAHMILHMGLVAVAAPILAFGLTRSVPALGARISPRFAILAALAEFVLVWSWHAPALHDAARRETWVLVIEQASFLTAGLLVWTAAFGTAEGARGARAAGVAALLMTSMHMTLLGALLLFAPRPLYACGDLCSPLSILTPLEDQQLGGVLMLIVGGSAYLVGGLSLLARLLNEKRDAQVPA
ncbi:cytochrome c oxidase assembly protein [Aureimonas phyllosphaerae]|uniref:Putative membrane protein n=1 Tax=Aureimonas phyllosphaerae TaxID=1166078 RepID=A0A7W6C281_9HYPH|nr:cytochrome c oxidase assembly protein [Aureimonas phyllosphaerae]MBB3937137.1 putative membrane protein [Aureimonas phyllosphaerae]MBB3961226.1 putative membrane protein [Aureimonas phyllosphaerae]SFF52207.1 putative membrane protein [Aureimonas phyllosphaerae]